MIDDLSCRRPVPSAQVDARRSRIVADTEISLPGITGSPARRVAVYEVEDRGGRVTEFFPVAAGLLCGLLLGSVTAQRRVVVGIAFSVVAGVLATVVSGEWRISWSFLLVDIPLVAISAVAGDLLSRRVVLWWAG